MAVLNRENSRTLLWAAAVSLIAGILYFVTAARDIVVGDTPELITVAATLGVPHPPGYPLFTMLGHLFSLLPLGPIPFRVNLFSLVCDALTVGIIFLTAFRLTRSHLAAVMAALVLALNPLFWSWSLVAEVFPLNNLLASSMIYLLVIWHEEPERPGILTAAAFIAGLALSNHQTIVLLGPAVCWLLWNHRAALFARPQTIAFCVVAFLIGLLPYAYVPWAAAHAPAYNWGDVSSLRDLIKLILRQSYGGYHLVAPGYRGGSAVQRIVALCFAFGALMSLLALLGLVRAYRSKNWYFWFSLIAAVFTGPLFVILTNLNVSRAPSAWFVLERFFLLPEVVIAPLIALGIVYLSEVIAGFAPDAPLRPASIVSAAVAVVLVVSLLTHYRRIDQSKNHIARTYGEDLLRTAQPDAILLVSGDGLALPPIYLNIVERMRPDVTIIVPPILPAYWYVNHLRKHDPNLKIPFEHYDRQQGNIRTLVEANPGRPVGVVGRVPDDSLENDYWPRLLGMINAVERKSKVLTLPQMVAENEQLIKQYRPPAASRINPKSFESEILALYAQPDWRLGDEYQRAGFKSLARDWYQRALAIDPNSPQALRKLAQAVD